MDRLTTNKDVSEMNMVELAHNSCYVKDHNAMFRSYDFDIDARNLARKLIRDIAKCDDDLSDNDYFDEWISDFLSDGTDSIKGLIAVFYSNLLAMAELRERLKEYEDIGLLPEQIKEVDRLYAEKCKELADLKKNYLSGLELAQIWAGLEQIKEYQYLEEQGKLLKLPVAIGDEIFYIFRDCPKDYKEEYCRDHEGSCENCHHRVPDIMSRKFRASDIQNMDNIFATREEAETALENMKKTEKKS